MAAVGAWAYVALVTVLGFLWSGYDPVSRTQSQLGSVASPFRWVMNIVGFMGLGVATLAFASAYALLLRGDRLKRVAVGLIGAAGTSVLVVGFFPLGAGQVAGTPSGRLHLLFAVLAAVGFPLAAVLSAPVLRADRRWSARWQVAALLVGALGLAYGALATAELVEHTSGLLQRVAMWPSLVWMAATAARMRTITRT